MTVDAARRAYESALRRELKAVDALGDKASEAQLEYCWRLASETNAALAALQEAQS